LIKVRTIAAWLAGAMLLPGPVVLANAPVPSEIPVALLVDLSTGQELYARQANRRFMPASVTKVMTAYTAFRLIDEGRINTGSRFLITPELEEQWSGEGSSMFLKAGERPTLGELLLGATTVSGNDASVALAMATTGSVRAWLDLMNENAAALGMRDTHFGSANGFPDEGRTFSSARDLARLGEAVVTRHPDLYRRYFGHPGLTWGEITQANHDPVTGKVPGADGMKTGFTAEAGFTFMGSGERDGRRLVMVIAGAPTSQLRDDAARAFLEWGFSAFSTRLMAPEGMRIGEATVQGGATDRVGLRAAREIRLAFPVGQAPVAVTTIRYDGPIEAPIAAGEAIATLHVEIDGQPPLDLPLLAAEEVPEAGFFRRLALGLAGLFA
jgi:serine-type D-Ala-D-Ala carboxypeptidase (penicillin-binding protein 5/6)